MLLRYVIPVFIALGVAGCDVNVQSCNGKQVCISHGSSPQIKGSGVSRSEARSVSSFTSVQFTGAGRVVIEMGETNAVTVTSDDNVLPKIKTETKDGVLSLGIPENTSIAANELTYRITAKDLHRIEATGAGSVQVSKIAGDVFEAVMTGSSNLHLSGKVKSVALAISGSGNVDATMLTADTAKIVSSGSGSASFNAHQTLDVVTSGSGNVTYSRTLRLRTTISGSGSLKPGLAS